MREGRKETLGSNDGLSLGCSDGMMEILGEAVVVGDVDGSELGSELGIDDGAPDTEGLSLGWLLG